MLQGELVVSDVQLQGALADLAKAPGNGEKKEGDDKADGKKEDKK